VPVPTPVGDSESARGFAIYHTCGAHAVHPYKYMDSSLAMWIISAMSSLKMGNFEKFPHSERLRQLIVAEGRNDTEAVTELLKDALQFHRRMFRAIKRYNNGRFLKTLLALAPFASLWPSTLTFGSLDPPLSPHFYEVSCFNFVLVYQR